MQETSVAVFSETAIWPLGTAQMVTAIYLPRYTQKSILTNLS